MTGSFPGDSKIEEVKVNYPIEISKEEVNNLEVKSFPGRITVVEDSEAVDLCVGYLRRKPVIGFDTESKPSFKKNSKHSVSLIQLAIPGEVFLFRIHKTGLRRSIIELFKDPGILKAGVSIHDDIKRLQSVKSFNPEGFIELQSLSSELGIISNSLRKLTAIILGFRISKAQQLSNWEADKLTENQLQYAATDAWVCLEIYQRLNELLHEN